jgi:hypothetical protein
VVLDSIRATFFEPAAAEIAAAIPAGPAPIIQMSKSIIIALQKIKFKLT